MADHSNEIQVRTLVENWAKAIREEDMEGVLAHHSDDIVMFDAPLPLQFKGIAAYKKQWALFFDYSPGGAGAFDLSELKITADDSVAFCHALVKVSGLDVRLTIGLRKVNGEWIVTHEHHSAPSD